MPPYQPVRRTYNGSAWRHCSMRRTGRGLGFDVISFNAAISACTMGVQWQRVAPLSDELH
eukprot:3124647-Karenia_brevis.AAC.1